MTEKNLWGKISSAARTRVPLIIMREQAALLRHLTKHILEGEVSVSGTNGKFEATLDIKAPRLDQYTYTVCTISYALNIYPLTLQDVANNTSRECCNEKDFETALGEVLSSERTHATIQSLLVQSKSVR